MNDPERPVPDADADGQPGPDQPAPQQPASPTPPPPPGQPAPQQQPPAPYAGTPVPPPYPQQPPYPGYGQPPYPQQPYTPYPQPPYPAPPQQPKRKAWPWVLGGCLLVLLIGAFSFVGCMSCAYFATVNSDSRYDYDYPDDYDIPYPDDGSGSYDSDLLGGFTREQIASALGEELPSSVEGGACTSGVFEVGPGKDIEPGRYFFEGRQDAESNFYVFEEEGPDSYRLDDAVVYFGNYFADLEAGDLVAFLGADESLRMRPEAMAAFKAEAPYQSGLYRVGADIPAGTYAISVNDQSEAAAGSEIAAFVMKDLEFSDDSITDTKYVIRGGSQTVTVKDGDWLELYGTVATPAK
ncbi:hypothetical protein [Arabiibacter massiliensis]|uniref:hypothetical protein n=1 Tax=Arabiibacter massiliensis TaxID=1870985 RepID=UPI0009BC5A07|nr:hypothetical protein [Arabiibacter massiliensis]